ncbi:hypothetical protein C7B64_10820 [Merismopedia glauca CCAP 1448/3]|uniref:Uncharacterized protein n=1 Tax=Merismopedia glauca CCAP 1448/3 TaxID=1296344 RepID=A0A2T1C3V4_9CYAN|nr:hypothetical protein C7B64_10820 [Merismopedia glauca CCAP 1448/3]
MPFPQDPLCFLFSKVYLPLGREKNVNNLTLDSADRYLYQFPAQIKPKLSGKGYGSSVDSSSLKKGI